MRSFLDDLRAMNAGDRIFAGVLVAALGSIGLWFVPVLEWLINL